MAFISHEHEEQQLRARIIERKLSSHGTKLDLILEEVEDIKAQLALLASTRQTVKIDLKAMVDTLWFRLGVLGTLWALGINLKDALAFLKF